MSDFWVGLGIVSMPNNYVGNSRVFSSGTWYALDLHTSLSFVEIARHDLTRFRIGDYIAAEGRLGYGTGGAITGFRANGGVQFAYRASDLVDFGLKVFGSVSLAEQINYIGLAARPHVRVGRVFGDFGFGVQGDQRWLDASLRYLYTASMRGTTFVGVQLMQASDANHLLNGDVNAASGRSSATSVYLILGSFFK